MDTKPDTIHVSTVLSEEIQASHADLIVSIKGTSFFSGDEALKKSKEVSQLVDGLTGLGLSKKDIRLQSITTESTGGNLLKSSSATYRLSIRCNKLEQFSDILTIIILQKNASLEMILWRYPDEQMREKLLDKAIALVQARAKKVADSLGVNLLGVYTFNENYMDADNTFRIAEAGFAQAKTRAVGIVPQADLGMEVQHLKKVEVRLDIEYRISGFTKE